MLTILKPFYWKEKDTNKMLYFIDSPVSTCGQSLESLGEVCLKALEFKKHIANLSEEELGYHRPSAPEGETKSKGHVRKIKRTSHEL